MAGMGRHGDGGITKRKDGRLQVSITLTSGRRLYRTVPRLTDGKRQMELAQRTRRELVTMREAELDPAGQLLRDYLRSWLDSMASAVNARLRPTTLAGYRIIAERHLIPVLGSLRLENVRERHVQAWLDGLALSPQYVAHCRAFLHRVMEVARKQRVIAWNPVEATELAKIPAYRGKPLTAAEAHRLIEATIDDRLGALWRLAVLTGLRESELLGLAWKAIDLERGTVTVGSQLGRHNGEWVFTAPKAERGVETIAIDAGTVTALRVHRARQAAERQPDWPYWGMAFVTPTGRPYHRVEIVKAFREACDKAGVARRRFHDLRGSTATIMGDLGVPEDVRMARLGHTTKAMARHYGQASMDQDRLAVERLAEAIG